jgi:hypothetical protein
MKSIIAISATVAGLAAMVAAINLHSTTHEFTPPVYEPEETVVEVAEVVPEVEPLNPSPEPPRAVKAVSRPAPAPRAQHCYTHVLLQQGRPGANTVQVCD